jgi:two-component system LytT family sensor kinase
VTVRPRIPVAVGVLAAWTVAGVLLAAQAYFSSHVRGDAIPLPQALAVWLGWAYTWALLTPAALWLHRRATGRWAPAVHLVAAPLFALANLAVFAAFAPALGALNAAETWIGTFRNLLGSAFVVNVPVYLLIVGIAHWRGLAQASRERETRALALERQLAEARLMTLRAQLNPHFLFNALNTIAVLMRENVDNAERVLLSLSSLLRTVLQASSVQFSRVEDEYALARNYLEVEQARFGERLAFRFDAAREALRARMPSLMLQPLVENCVRHAAGAKLGVTRIAVSAVRAGDRLRLTVRDDGPGLSAPGREGIGLSNTRARLAVLYPGAHEFTVEDAADGGVVATITLPYRTADDAAHADR